MLELGTFDTTNNFFICRSDSVDTPILDSVRLAV